MLLAPGVGLSGSRRAPLLRRVGNQTQALEESERILERRARRRRLSVLDSFIFPALGSPCRSLLGENQLDCLSVPVVVAELGVSRLERLEER